MRAQPTRLVLPAAAGCLMAFFACQSGGPALAKTKAPRTRPVAAAAASSPLVEAAPPPAPSSSSPPSSPSPSPVSSPARPIESVLVLGDSLTDEKVGGGGFVRILRERCRGVPFDNQAKGGFMVNQIRKRLETKVLPEGKPYSHAIVFGGVNDLYSDQTANRSLARIEADLSQIYAELARRGTRVVAITVTPWGGFKRWYTEQRGKNT